MMTSRTRRIAQRSVVRSLFVVFSMLLVTASAATTLGQERPADQQSPPLTTPQAPIANGQKPGVKEVPDDDVVQVETQLVSLPVLVTNQQGHPVAGLRQDNFIVSEDGQKQTIANFGTMEAPFEIALLLDTSGSTRADVDLIRQAANAFIEALRPGDRVAVVAFKDTRRGDAVMAAVEVLAQLTDDRKALRAAIQNLGSSNGTPFYDALQTITDDVFREPPRPEVRGRRAVVALTDGVDSTSSADFATVRSKLLRAGVSCYFIQVNTEDFVEDRLLKDCQDDGKLTLSAKQLDRYRRIYAPGAKREDYADFCRIGQFQRMQISRDLYALARSEMDDLALAAGSRNFAAATLPDARAAFSRIAEEIGRQYSLNYYSTNRNRDGKFRRITVELTGVNGKNEVRAREGYNAAPK